MSSRRISPESQKNEYKSSWQAEYFEWICGFANAKGGTICVGVNDDGYVVGLKDTKYLLDVLPNQVTDKMGIIVEVDHDVAYERGANLKYEKVPFDIASKPINLYVRGKLTKKTVEDIDRDPANVKQVTPEVQRLFNEAEGFVKQLRKSKEYRDKVLADIDKWEHEKLVNASYGGVLEYVIITVPSYPNAIDFEGHYYVRSGGTTRELKGIQLAAFLMDKSGRHWDGMPMPGVKVSDLDAAAINSYRKKAIEKGRHSEADVNVSDEQVISDLKLFDESISNKGELMRAAVLMFHPDPERFVTGASIKIAYYAPEGAYGANKADDIIYYDMIQGPLIQQADKVVDIMYTKYLKALVSYEGLQRIETFMTPKGAFREVILNAINHKLYESGNPIQISVYDDKIVVFNQGQWPEDIELEDIYEKKHSSYPHNPNLSKVFFSSGEIEAYGGGFRKIKIECDKANAPYPEVDITPNGVTVEIKACEMYMKLLKRGRYWKTYPEYKIDEAELLTDHNGEVITDHDGVPLIVHAIGDVDPNVLASVDRMMDVLTNSLSEEEKIAYAPLVEFLKTHDEIKNQDGVRLTKRSAATVNRYLSRMVELGVLEPKGEKKGRIYRRK